MVDQPPARCLSGATALAVDRNASVAQAPRMLDYARRSAQPIRRQRGRPRRAPRGPYAIASRPARAREARATIASNGARPSKSSRPSRSVRQGDWQSVANASSRVGMGADRSRPSSKSVPSVGIAARLGRPRPASLIVRRGGPGWPRRFTLAWALASCGRVGAGQLALAARGRVGMEHPARARLVDLGRRDLDVGRRLVEIVGRQRRHRPLGQRLDDLLGDAIMQAALGALPHALGRGR